MTGNITDLKFCVDCGKKISFQEFCEINSSLTEEQAEGLYYNPIINIYCPNCYFKRPEKPFKTKRRRLDYFKLKNNFWE